MLSMVEGSSTTLNASWLAPNPANGMITGYTIRCSVPSALEFSGIDGEDNSFILQDLMPFTVYQCQITATTSVGEGDPSETQTARTDEDGKLETFIHLIVKYNNHLNVRAGPGIITNVRKHSTSYYIHV